jgi:hypothetical protein
MTARRPINYCSGFIRIKFQKNEIIFQNTAVNVFGLHLCYGRSSKILLSKKNIQKEINFTAQYLESFCPKSISKKVVWTFFLDMH